MFSSRTPSRRTTCSPPAFNSGICRSTCKTPIPPAAPRACWKPATPPMSSSERGGVSPPRFWSVSPRRQVCHPAALGSATARRGSEVVRLDSGTVRLGPVAVRLGPVAARWGPRTARRVQWRRPEVPWWRAGVQEWCAWVQERRAETNRGARGSSGGATVSRGGAPQSRQTGPGSKIKVLGAGKSFSGVRGGWENSLKLWNAWHLAP